MADGDPEASPIFSSPHLPLDTTGGDLSDALILSSPLPAAHIPSYAESRAEAEDAFSVGN